jgi:hypothetical protein
MVVGFAVYKLLNKVMANHTVANYHYALLLL